MNISQKLDQFLKENDGILRTSRLAELGISKTAFYTYVKSRGMEKVSHGTYALTDSVKDELYLFHLRSSLAVFSHETALFLHGFVKPGLYGHTIQEEAGEGGYEITLPTGYNPSNFSAAGIKVYTVKKELFDLGKTSIHTPLGHSVPVYNVERSVCDMVRSRNKFEDGIMQEYIKQYVRRPDKNLKELMHFAYRFRIEKMIKSYLDILL